VPDEVAEVEAIKAKFAEQRYRNYAAGNGDFGDAELASFEAAVGATSGATDSSSGNNRSDAANKNSAGWEAVAECERFYRTAASRGDVATLARLSDMKATERCNFSSPDSAGRNAMDIAIASEQWARRSHNSVSALFSGHLLPPCTTVCCPRLGRPSTSTAPAELWPYAEPSARSRQFFMFYVVCFYVLCFYVFRSFVSVG
jgi:hypothetical protein